jgi:hypothetical protein
LDGKTACIKTILGFKIWLDGKKLLVLKNYLVKINCLHGKKIYIENFFWLKEFLLWKKKIILKNYLN